MLLASASKMLQSACERPPCDRSFLFLSFISAADADADRPGAGRTGDRHLRTYWRQDILATKEEPDLLATVIPDLLATVGKGVHMGKGMRS